MLCCYAGEEVDRQVQYVQCTSCPDIIESERDGIRIPPIQCAAKFETSIENLKCAPVPSALEALRQTAHAGLWTLRRCGCLNRLCTCAAVAGAFAIAPTQAEVLPFTEGAVTAITGTMPLAFRMETCKLI